MTDIPLDYRGELQSAADFIVETIQASERFRSYHWVLATDNKQSFADSRAIVGGPVDMRPLADTRGPSATVRHHLQDMLGLKAVYAVNLPLDVSTVSPKDVLTHFRACPPEKLVVITASGQRLSETSPWLFNLAFVAHNQPGKISREACSKTGDSKAIGRQPAIFEERKMELDGPAQ